METGEGAEKPAGQTMQRSRILPALPVATFLASAALSQAPPHQLYLITAFPLMELCIAVDPTPPARAWWWQSFTATCSTRATGPGLFELTEARIQADRGTPGVKVQFRLALHAPAAPGGERFRDIEVVFADDTVLDVASRTRVALIRRENLEIPEFAPRGRRVR
jgi:hypothetical protein